MLLVLWVPGRLLVASLPELREAPGRGWLALAASMGVVPVVLSWTWRFTNQRWVVLTALAGLGVLLLLVATRAALCGGCLGEAANDSSGSSRGVLALFDSRGWNRVLAGLLLYVGACVLGALWLPRAFDGVAPQAAEDYVKHHAILLSLERGPLPIRSVFYAGEPDTAYYYYEYHHYLAAALRKLTGDAVPIPLAFGLSSAVLACTLIALVCMLALPLTGRPAAALLAGACVSIVGGWDCLPVLVRILSGQPPPIILDSWISIPWRMHNLMTQFVWCPQHVAALLVLVLAAIGLRAAPRARWWIVAGPVLAASVFGSSAYLAMVFFPAAVLFVLLRLAERRTQPERLRREGLGLVAIACLGAALMVPQAWGYVEMSRRYPGGLTWQWPRMDVALLGRWVAPGPLANWLDAPWVLLIDLGLAGCACWVVGRAFWAKLWQDQGVRLIVLSGVLGLAAAFTIRSDVSPLDYGFRVAIEPAQVVAAICAGALFVRVLDQLPARWLAAAAVVAGLVLGLPAGLYEAPLMAVRSLVLRNPNTQEAGALRFLRSRTPREAIVQGDPLRRLDLPQLIDRRTAVLDPNNAHVRVFFPLNEARMRQCMADVEQAFRTTSPESAYDLLRAAGATHVLLGRFERERLGAGPQFDDTRFFERIYADAAACAYRLKDPPGR